MDRVLDPLVIVVLNSKLQFIKGSTVVILPRFLDLDQVFFELFISLPRLLDFNLKLFSALFKVTGVHHLILKIDSSVEDI